MNPSGMNSDDLRHAGKMCCCGNHSMISRRKFVQVTGTAALSTATVSGLSWISLTSRKPNDSLPVRRQTLRVKPVLTYEIPERREQTSWRNWGGIQTKADVLQELDRITNELMLLVAKADFPMEFLPVAGIQNTNNMESITDLNVSDAVILYAAGGWMDILEAFNKTGKPVLIFCRHKSGPVYLWYEIISPRYLRQHTDKLSISGIDENDVVIDNQDELIWRLRALSGLKNTLDATIVAIGGPDAWAQPQGIVPELVKDKFRLDIKTVSYEELGKLITAARSDNGIVNKAREMTDQYLREGIVRVGTGRHFIENCFILKEVFMHILENYNTRTITINQCMGTIMPLADTSACLTLSLLNDAGYLAFCESDFVAIPAGMLLGNIAGKPVFLNDPTYPHDGIITLAHCTAPRRMDGLKCEPVRLMTHFESDYGAAPKVEMKIGQTVTNIMPDFAFKRNVGMLGKIVDNPDMAICRSQIDISYKCSSKTVAEKMPGFHWITVYGDYMRETEYALKKIGIDFENLTPA